MSEGKNMLRTINASKILSLAPHLLRAVDPVADLKPFNLFCIQKILFSLLAFVLRLFWGPGTKTMPHLNSPALYHLSRS